MPFLSRLQKGPAERGHVKKRQKSSKSVKCFSTLFDSFRAGQKTSKIVKKCQIVFRHFSTNFARHHFSGPFWGAPIFCSLKTGSFGENHANTNAQKPAIQGLHVMCFQADQRRAFPCASVCGARTKARVNVNMFRSKTCKVGKRPPLPDFEAC